MITLNKNILESKSVEYIEYEGLLSDFIMTNILRELEEGYVINTVCNNSVVDFHKEDFNISESDDVQISISPAQTALVGFLIQLAISFAITWLLKKLTEPDMDGINDKSGTLYEININSMDMRPDGVIKEIFGTFLTYPDLIASPYKRYEDGEEITFLTTVLGVGEYSIDEMFINGEKASNILLNTVDNSDNNLDGGTNFVISTESLGGSGKAGSVPLGFEGGLASKFIETEIIENKHNPKSCDGYSFNSVIDCLNINQDNLNVVKLDGLVNSISSLSDKRFSDYTYLVHELVDFKDFNLIDFDREEYVKLNPHDEEAIGFNLTGKLTKSSRLDYKFDIDSFEIDIVAPSGIYEMYDGGILSLSPKPVHTRIQFDIFCYQLNDQGIQVNKNSFHWEKNMKTGKKQRWTERFSLPRGSGWYIQLRNMTHPGTLDNNIYNDFFIDRIKGLSTNSIVGTEGLTYLIFKIKTGEVFKSNTNLKLGIRATRKGLTKMNDVVNYIWSSSGYNFLELANTNELLSKYEVHGAIDSAAPLYEQINRVLRAQELYLIPTIGGFKVREDLLRHNLTYNFDKSNIIKSSIDISYINYNKAINDGYKAVYIDHDGKKQEETYPPEAYNPKEQIVFGVRDKLIAKNRARIGYKRMIGQSKTIKFSTEKEGYIPELGDKIGVTENHISDTFVSNQIGYNGTTIYLDKEVLLKGNDYASIKSEYEDSEVRRKILTQPGYTRELVIEGYSPNDFKTAIVIGVEKEIYKHYLVKEINPSSSGELELTCLIYNPGVYV